WPLVHFVYVPVHSRLAVGKIDVRLVSRPCLFALDLSDLLRDPGSTIEQSNQLPVDLVDLNAKLLERHSTRSSWDWRLPFYGTSDSVVEGWAGACGSASAAVVGLVRERSTRGP